MTLFCGDVNFWEIYHFSLPFFPFLFILELSILHILSFLPISDVTAKLVNHNLTKNFLFSKPEVALKRPEVAQKRPEVIEKDRK